MWLWKQIYVTRSKMVRRFIYLYRVDWIYCTELALVEQLPVRAKLNTERIEGKAWGRASHWQPSSHPNLKIKWKINQGKLSVIYVSQGLQRNSINTQNQTLTTDSLSLTLWNIFPFFGFFISIPLWGNIFYELFKYLFWVKLESFYGPQ